MEINVDAGEGKKNRLEMEQNSSVCLSNVNISLNLCNCTQISVDGINFHEKKKKFSSLQSDLIHQLRMKLKKTFRARHYPARLSHPTDPSDINADSKCHWRL